MYPESPNSVSHLKSLAKVLHGHHDLPSTFISLLAHPTLCLATLKHLELPHPQWFSSHGLLFPETSFPSGSHQQILIFHNSASNIFSYQPTFLLPSFFPSFSFPFGSTED
jgi:hypothetical protein